MRWEIRDMGPSPCIINIQLDASTLKWDFLQGSPYELCAVFPWDGQMSLADYQKAGSMPVLYHRRLKTRRSVLYDGARISGYCLYPATVENGTLYIGNQQAATGVLMHPVQRTVSVHILVKREGLFGTGTPVPRNRIRLDLDSSQEKLYYRVFSSRNMYPAMCMEAVSEDVWICLRSGEKITFYKDEDCTEEIRAT